MAESKEQEILLKHEKALVEDLRYDRMRVDVLTALGLTDDAWPAGARHEHRADCHIILETETLNDALIVAENLNPLPIIEIRKHSFLSFLPEECISEKDMEFADIADTVPWYYRISGPKGYDDTKVIHCYTRASTYIVHVQIKVAGDPLTYRVFKYDKEDRVQVNDLVNKSGHFVRKNKFYAPTNNPSDWVLR